MLWRQGFIEPVLIQGIEKQKKSRFSHESSWGNRDSIYRIAD